MAASRTSSSPAQVARDALTDAGYLGGHDHTNTGIVLGHSTYLHRGQAGVVQHGVVLDQTVDLLVSVCPSLDGRNSSSSCAPR